MNFKSPLYRQSAVVLAQHILNAALSLILTIVIARLLGPSKQGVYVMGVLLATLLATLGEGGVSAATVYWLNQKRYSFAMALRYNALLAFVWSLLSVLLFLILRLWFFQEFSWTVIFLSLSTVPFILFHSYVLAIVQASQRFKIHGVLSLLPRLGLLLFIVFSFRILNEKIALFGFLISHIFAAFSAALWVLKNSHNGVHALRLTDLKQLSTFGLKAYTGNVLAFLSYRIDQFILNAFLPSREVGLYAVAVGIGERLWMLSQSTSIVTFTKASSNSLEWLAPTNLLLRRLFRVMLLGCCALAIVAKPLILVLFGKEYEDSVTALWALLPGIIALSHGRVIATAISAHGKPLAHVGVGVVSLVVNILTNLFLIPLYGIIGAAIASSFSYVVYAFMVSVLYCRMFDVSWREMV